MPEQATNLVWGGVKFASGVPVVAAAVVATFAGVGTAPGIFATALGGWNVISGVAKMDRGLRQLADGVQEPFLTRTIWRDWIPSVGVELLPKFTPNLWEFIGSIP